MNELLKGIEQNEMVEGSAICETGVQIQEYQSKLSEAIDAGDTESVNYFRGQIEKLNIEMGEGTALHEIGEQIQEYQARLSEAVKHGDIESTNYFQSRIEKLNAEAEKTSNVQQVETDRGVQDTKQLSFGASYRDYSKDELKRIIADTSHDVDYYAKKAADMMKSNLAGNLSKYAKSSIDDNLHSSKKAQEEMKALKRELDSRK